MVFTSQMYYRISVLVPVLAQVPEYLFMSTSMSTITLELTSTSKVLVPEIQYLSTASTSTEYDYPSPDDGTILLICLPLSWLYQQKIMTRTSQKKILATVHTYLILI